MAFNGGIKFFEPSKSLGADGSTIVASTGTSSQDYALDRNPLTVWRSVGSDDITTETLTITFPAAISMNRLFCLGINWLDFDIDYDSNGALTWTDFSNIRGLDTDPDALESAIDETAWADNIAYYEFDAVTAYAIRIRIDSTQTANQEKYLNQFIATSSIGEFTGYPILNFVHNKNQKAKRALSGRETVINSIDTYQFTLNFNDYPTGYSADVDLAFQLYNRDQAFLSWLCGGNRGATYFGHQPPGIRLQDVIPTKIINAPDINYTKNIYVAQINLDFEFREVTL